MILADSHPSPFCSPYSVSVLSTGCSIYTSTQAKCKEKKKQLFGSPSRGVRKGFLRTPQKTLLSSYCPKPLCTFISRPINGKGHRIAFTPCRPSPETEARGLHRGGVDPWPKSGSCWNTESRKWVLASNSASTTAQPLSLQSHGEGQTGSQSLSVQIHISWDAYFSFCSLVPIVPLGITVTSLDTKSTPLGSPAEPLSSEHQMPQSLWLSVPRSLYHLQTQGTLLHS